MYLNWRKKLWNSLAAQTGGWVLHRVRQPIADRRYQEEGFQRLFPLSRSQHSEETHDRQQDKSRICETQSGSFRFSFKNLVLNSGARKEGRE